MKYINNITVLDDDKNFLSMLKGYCYANNITMTTADFNRDGIKEIEQLNPDLIIVPLDWLSSTIKDIENHLLWPLSLSGVVKICGLNRNTIDTVSVATDGVDIIINNPLDIAEIDNYLKKTFLFGSLNEKRKYRDRRAFVNRRRHETNRAHNHGYDGNNEYSVPEYLHHAKKPKCNDLEIDSRKKCIFLKGKKVDLTPKEFELIELLATDVERIFMADEIINHLWPESNRATKSDLYQYMHLLRKKIEIDANNPQWLITIKGFGYRLNVNHTPTAYQDFLPFLSTNAIN